jgi:NAD(P)-dependent dehydrogenase (short-subunit alcohol dehydrogenase family)
LPDLLPNTIWPDRFKHKVILLTGAAGGLGSAARSRLTAEGAVVVATDAQPPTANDPLMRQLDVRDRLAWKQVLADLLEEHGRLDGALFCHGIQGPESPVEDMSVEGWDTTLDVNLNGCFHGLALLLPILREQGHGKIAVLSSIAAREGNPHQAAYSASKAALISLVKTAAKEVAPYGVTINAVAPSMFETPLINALSPERNKELLARVPMGRIGKPEEFASLAAWLLSEESSYMTGQTLDLSGGRNTA